VCSVNWETDRQIRLVGHATAPTDEPIAYPAFILLLGQVHYSLGVVQSRTFYGLNVTKQGRLAPVENILTARIVGLNITAIIQWR